MCIRDRPIAHGEGRYQCSSDVLKKLQDDDSIALRYADNPNGSINDIAGITNKQGNVLQYKNDFDEIFSSIIRKNDYLMIKGSNATGLSKLSKLIIKGTSHAI